MNTLSDLRARRLVNELQLRSQGRLRFADQKTEEMLVREFKERLDASTKPDELFSNWQNNLDVYIRRTGAHLRPVVLTEDMVRFQFKLCKEFCPPPIMPFIGQGGAGTGSSTGSPTAGAR